MRGGPEEGNIGVYNNDLGSKRILTRDPGGVGEVPDALLSKLPGEIENHRDNISGLLKYNQYNNIIVLLTIDAIQDSVIRYDINFIQ